MSNPGFYFDEFPDMLNYYRKEEDFSCLKGETITLFKNLYIGSSEVVMWHYDQERYILYSHESDFCTPFIDKIVGNIDDILFTPLINVRHYEMIVPRFDGSECSLIAGHEFTTKNGVLQIHWFGASETRYMKGVRFARAVTWKNVFPITMAELNHKKIKLWK